ncbi:hypothetical protein E3A20_07920, partial [Planctomyces bekefii]
FRVLESGGRRSREESEAVGYAAAYFGAEWVPLFEAAVAVEILQSCVVFSDGQDLNASGICAAAIEFCLQQSHIDRVSSSKSIEGDRSAGWIPLNAAVGRLQPGD